MKTFIRSLIATDDNGNIISSYIAQPYLVGMYVAITFPNRTMPTQLSLTHKQYAKWSKSSKAKMEKAGYTVEVFECAYTDFLPEEELKEFGII